MRRIGQIFITYLLVKWFVSFVFVALLFTGCTVSYQPECLSECGGGDLATHQSL